MRAIFIGRYRLFRRACKDPSHHSCAHMPVLSGEITIDETETAGQGWWQARCLRSASRHLIKKRKLQKSSVRGMLVVGAVDYGDFGVGFNSGRHIINAYAAVVDIPMPIFLNLVHTEAPNSIVSKDSVSMLHEVHRLSRPITPGAWPLVVGAAHRLERSDEQRLLRKPDPGSRQQPASGSSLGQQRRLVPATTSARRRQRARNTGVGPDVRFRPGRPGPICSASCGILCDAGFYCDVHPTGALSEFTQPATTKLSNSITGLPTLAPAPSPSPPTAPP